MRDSLSQAQLNALAIIPHVTAVFSFLGSAFILQDIWKDSKKRKRTYSILLTGVSAFDCVSSFTYFLGTWPIPESPTSNLFASGTTLTCTLQGFFMQLGDISVLMYQLGLASYYVLVLVYSWSNQRVKQMEKYVHTLAFVLGLGISMAGLPLTLYNDSNLWCWIASVPAGCGTSKDATGECDRGDNAWIYRWALYYAPLWFVIFVITLLMTKVSYHVYLQEKKSRKYRKQPIKNKKGKKMKQKKDKIQELSSQVFWQSIHYVLAFYMTFIFPTINRTLQTFNQPVPYGVVVCMCFFLPLNGFWNFTVYVRPRYLRYREKHPDSYWWRSVWKTVFRQQQKAATTSGTGANNKSNTNKAPTPNMPYTTSAEVWVRNSSGDDEQRGQEQDQQAAAEQGSHDDERPLSRKTSGNFKQLSFKMSSAEEDDDVEDEEEEDADVMDPAYALMQSRRILMTNETALTTDNSGAFLGGMQEEDKDEDDSISDEVDAPHHHDRRGMWHHMKGVVQKVELTVVDTIHKAKPTCQSTRDVVHEHDRTQDDTAAIANEEMAYTFAPLTAAMEDAASSDQDSAHSDPTQELKLSY